MARSSSNVDAARESTVVVRKATVEDLDGICAVAEAVKLDAERPRHEGFLVYVLDRQGYAERLASTDLFYVALDVEQVVGFLLCYQDRTLVDLVRKGVLGADLLRARNAAGCGERSLYCDQLAVLPAHAHQRIGPALVMRAYADVADRGIESVFVGILHQPLNTVSKAFCEGLGFRFQASLRYEDGRVWGLYRRDLPKQSHAATRARR